MLTLRAIKSGLRATCEICLKKLTNFETVNLDKVIELTDGTIKKDNLTHLAIFLKPFYQDLRSIDEEIGEEKRTNLLLKKILENIILGLEINLDSLIEEEDLAEILWDDKRYLVDEIIRNCQMQRSEAENKDGNDEESVSIVGEEGGIEDRPTKRLFDNSSSCSKEEICRGMRVNFASDIKEFQERGTDVGRESLSINRVNQNKDGRVSDLAQKSINHGLYLKGRARDITSSEDGDSLEDLKCLSPPVVQGESKYKLVEKTVSFGILTPKKSSDLNTSRSPDYKHRGNFFGSRNSKDQKQKKANFFSDPESEKKPKVAKDSCFSLFQ